MPTLDELIGTGDITEDNVAAHLLAYTRDAPQVPQVFTLHAELEGMRMAAAFEQLIVGWKAQGYELVPTRRIYENLIRSTLPYYAAVQGEISGRSGALLLQGKPFLPILEKAA